MPPAVQPFREQVSSHVNPRLSPRRCRRDCRSLPRLRPRDRSCSSFACSTRSLGTHASRLFGVACKPGREKPYLACRSGKIVGFIELEDDGHIDRFYTHKDFQRQGVGHALYDHLVVQADVRGIHGFYVEASPFARPFFEREGFQLKKENRIERAGQILTNFSMSLERTRGVEV